jgi:ABC-type transport system involved in Fe-S cluster assembly fused permease/ATPase subunit
MGETKVVAINMWVYIIIIIFIVINIRRETERAGKAEDDDARPPRESNCRLFEVVKV